MDTTAAARIRSDAAFAELERRRTSFSWTLTVIMLLIYFAFIFLVAFAPSVMATPVAGVITLGFPIGILVILSAVVLTGIYVVRANGEFDRLTTQIQQGVRR